MAYTAIILDPQARLDLKTLTLAFVPEGWQSFCHHVTLNMGQMDTSLNDAELLGADCIIEVDAIGMTDKAIAVRVASMKTLEGTVVKSKNKTPHITIAVNAVGGGKPKMSNDIKIWGPFAMQLNGKIFETGT